MGLTYEDFTGWTENDGLLSQTVTRSTWASVKRSDVAYLYEDFGAGYWNDFTVQFTLRVSDCTPDSTTLRAVAAAWMNVIDDWAGNKDAMGMGLAGTATAGVCRVNIQWKNAAGATGSSTYINLNEDTDYYVVFRKEDEDLYLDVYSDPNHTTLVGSRSYTMAADVNFRYMYVPVSLSFGGSPNDASSGYIEYLAEAENASEDLKATFHVGQDSEDLFADFIVRQTGTADLFSELVIRHTDTQDLFAEFELQKSEDLFADFIVRQEASEGLFAEFTIRQGIQDLFCDLIIRRTGTADLFADFIAIRRGTADLFAEFVVRNADTEDLHGFFHVGQDSAQLFSKMVIRHTATPLEVFAELVIRHTATYDMPAYFEVGQGWENLRNLVLINGIGYIVRGEYAF
jgi:hypothetical protein